MRTGKFQRMLTFVCALLMAQGAWAQDAAVVGHVKIGDLYYNLDVQNHTAQVTYDPTDSGEKYKGLTAVSIPASVSYEEQEFSVTEIGVRAFAYCMTDLTTVSIAEGVTCIGDSVFYGCEQLAGMVIPNSVSSIGHSAFTYCYAMTGLTIGSGVKTIGDDAFYFCNGIKSVTIPNSVESIGDRAFGGCKTLTTVTIGSGVTSIGGNVFTLCDNLAEIIVSAENPAYCSEDGVLFNKDKTTIIQCPTTKTGDYAIPGSVTRIENAAFSSCKGLTAVTIPDGVKYIGDAAFSNCSSLTGMIIPNSVTTIGGSAFTNCTGLTSLTIGSGVTTIGNAAFVFCSGLTSVYNYAVTPQKVESVTFFGVKDADCTLYVPAESADLYKAANIWKGFNVVAMKAEPSLALKQLMSGDECTVYTFNYPSVSASGEPTVLSSALFAWTPSEREETDSIESLHIYSHATITADYERPSTNEGFSKEQALLLLFPNREYGNVLADEYANYVSRCIVIAPDYEGYGLTKDSAHPYLSQRLTAQQIIDAVKYGLELYKKETSESTTLLPMKSDWRSFCLGYSQGGAVSLATHRQIEELGLADELRFQGTVCGDGPYDLVTTMRYYFEDDGTSYGVETAHRKGKVTLPVVVPLILKGMSDTHADVKPYGIGSYLSQQLLDTGVLSWIDSKAFTTSEIAAKWYDQLQEGVDTLDRHYTPEQMGEMFESPKTDKVWGKVEKIFAPAVYDYLSDVSHYTAVPAVPADAPQALHRALADNSVATGWEPQHRIQFFHSKYDVIVPYGNYLAFRDAHPGGEGSLYRIDDTFSTGDHMDAGATFLLYLLTVKDYGSVFNWICEGNTTGIRQISNAKLTVDHPEGWYTIDGRRLSVKPTQKGVYINKGMKVVVR